MRIETSLVWYSIGVAVLCLIAFLSNPLIATSSLYSGTVLIAVALTVRALMKSKPHVAWWSLFVFLVLVILALGYRAFLGWGSVFSGRVEKTIAASCVTGIVAISALLLARLLKKP